MWMYSQNDCRAATIGCAEVSDSAPPPMITSANGSAPAASSG